MNEPEFWINTSIYYISIASMIIQPNIPATIITAILFINIPHSTQTEIIPGYRQSFKTQYETLKTQRWLSKEGYYT